MLSPNTLERVSAVEIIDTALRVASYAVLVPLVLAGAAVLVLGPMFLCARVFKDYGSIAYAVLVVMVFAGVYGAFQP